MYIIMVNRKILFNNINNYKNLYRTSFKNFKLILTLISIIICDLINIIDCSAPCSPCDIKNELKYNKKPPAKATSDEYMFEHQVNKLQAIEHLRKLNYSTDGQPDPSCKAIQCSKRIMQYCLGGQFLNDHCWCEQAHEQEGLPFVPHNCFVGDGSQQASIGSCYFYLEVKECCCIKALIKRWKYLSSSPNLKSTNFTLLFILPFLHWFLKNYTKNIHAKI